MEHWPALWLFKWLVKSHATNSRTTTQIYIVCTKHIIYWAVDKCYASFTSFTSHAWHFSTCHVWSHLFANEEVDSPGIVPCDKYNNVIVQHCECSGTWLAYTGHQISFLWKWVQVKWLVLHLLYCCWCEVDQLALFSTTNIPWLIRNIFTNCVY